MTRSTFNLKLLQDNEGTLMESICAIEFENRQPCAIDFQHSTLGVHRFEGEDLFAALCNLRRFLERESIKILCNGARIDAYPSPMSRDMCGGTKLHILKEGQPTNRQDLVFIFNEAPSELIGTVDEQFSYYQKWLAHFIERE